MITHLITIAEYMGLASEYICIIIPLEGLSITNFMCNSSALSYTNNSSNLITNSAILHSTKWSITIQENISYVTYVFIIIFIERERVMVTGLSYKKSYPKL